MSKLIIYSPEGSVDGEYVLAKERVTIGRKPHNDIQLSHAFASGEHALVITIRDDSFLEDLDSTNGIRVNNKPVKKCVLQDGDEIHIAKYMLKYVYEPLLQPIQDDGDDLGWLMEDTVGDDRPLVAQHGGPPGPLADTQNAADTLVLPERSPSGKAAPLVAGIQILSGPGAGKELALERTLTTIGKPGVQVAVIARRSQGYFLTYIEGGGYPLLNGVSVGPHSLALKNHDIIELAGTKMEFFLR